MDNTTPRCGLQATDDLVVQDIDVSGRKHPKSAVHGPEQALAKDVQLALDHMMVS